jgi:putative transposase
MTKPVSYKRHRFPTQIIAHAVWLYFRFPLSLRLVEEMLLERGVVVSYETVQRWAMKFGPDYARRLRRKTPSPRDIWHLDEVVITIAGQQYWLWRAIDQDGYVLDEIVQTRRNTKAAKCLLKRLKKQGCPPRRLITDKLGSYAAARRQIMPAVEHRSHKGLNNRAENYICRCAGEKGECRASGQREAYRGLLRCSPPSTISSFHPAPTALLLPPICIASIPWRNGKPWRALPLEHLCRQSGLTASNSG